MYRQQTSVVHSLYMPAQPFLTPSERCWLELVSPLSYANPFLPDRIRLERAILGNEFVEGEPVWSYRVGDPHARVNIGRIMARLEPFLEELRGRLVEDASPRDRDLNLYE